MAKRGTVTDYAGEGLRVGDLVNYATRCANRVRVTDALVEQIDIRRAYGKLIPFLLVQPVGVDSGNVGSERKSLRREWISTEHVRLLRHATK
jgi:hypothetical protein